MMSKVLAAWMSNIICVQCECAWRRACLRAGTHLIFFRHSISMAQSTLLTGRHFWMETAFVISSHNRKEWNHEVLFATSSWETQNIRSIHYTPVTMGRNFLWSSFLIFILICLVRRHFIYCTMSDYNKQNSVRMFWPLNSYQSLSKCCKSSFKC